MTITVDSAEGVTLRRIADRWPASWAFIGGISYRSLRYSRMAVGETPGSGQSSLYFVDDVRRLVLRHVLAEVIGARVLPLRFDAALADADWSDERLEVRLFLGRVFIGITLPALVFSELQP